MIRRGERIKESLLIRNKINNGFKEEEKSNIGRELN